MVVFFTKKYENNEKELTFSCNRTELSLKRKDGNLFILNITTINIHHATSVTTITISVTKPAK